jgi:hypothetical protein
VPEASAGADIVILVLPLGKYRSIPTEAVRGKPVIDAMNTGGKSTASATTDLAKVASLVHAIGFDPVIAGPLAEGMRLEPGTEAFGAKRRRERASRHTRPLSPTPTAAGSLPTPEPPPPNRRRRCLRATIDRQTIGQTLCLSGGPVVNARRASTPRSWLRATQ